MNIYLVSQDENTGYDTYDSFICYADTEEEAQNMLPSVYGDWENPFGTWCSSPDKASVTFLGTDLGIDPDINAGVILTSFNAG